MIDTDIGIYKLLEIEELEELLRNEKLIHFVGKLGIPTPGVMLFCGRLEFFHFPPGTEKNEDFNREILDWEDMEWVVISIPKEYMGLANEVAKESGLRIVEGGPRGIIEGKSIPFPLKSNNLFTLERIPRQIHEGLKEYKEVILEEIEKVKSIERDYVLKNKEKQKLIKIIWDEK